MGTGDQRTSQILKSDPIFSRRFDVLECLGEGAAGAVYRVRDKNNKNLECALKVLIDAKAFDEHTLDRFRKEIEVLKTVRHSNLVYAYDLIETPTVVAYTLELVKGSNLGQHAAAKRLSYTQIDLVFSQILSALHELHQFGIVHRDLKLENILMAPNGIAKVSDLGLMKQLDGQSLTKTGILLGTAQYLPPEYVKFGEFDVRGDLYAVGVMLYECLTGTRWLRDKRGNEAIDFLITIDFKFPEQNLRKLPDKYREILQRALAGKPEDRYQDADSMRRALMQPMHEPSQENAIVVKENINLIQRVHGRRLLNRAPRWLKLSPMFFVMIGILGVLLPIGLVSQGLLKRQGIKELPILPGNYKGSLQGTGKSHLQGKLKLKVADNEGEFEGDLPNCPKGKLTANKTLQCNKKSYQLIVNALEGANLSGVVSNDSTHERYLVELARTKG